MLSEMYYLIAGVLGFLRLALFSYLETEVFLYLYSSTRDQVLTISTLL